MRGRDVPPAWFGRVTCVDSAYRLGLHNAGHSDIRTTDLYFTRRDDDAEKAARNIRIRVPTRQGN
jgi:hypothetical protein